MPGRPLTAREARDAHLAASGHDLAGYDRPDFPVTVGWLRLRFPNPGQLHLHDLHHVATGYATDLDGEACISAFELRAGCRSPLILLLCVGALALALIRHPEPVLRAWRRAAGCRSLYRSRVPYRVLLALPVERLRGLLGIPGQGFAPPNRSSRPRPG